LAGFVLIISGMFIPGASDLLFKVVGRSVFLFELLLFFILGVLLIILVFKNKITNPLRKFLLLTGFSVVGLALFAVLHNLISGVLGAIFNSEIEEPVFFLLAVFACPLGFLIGAIRSISLFFKEGRGNN